MPKRPRLTSRGRPLVSSFSTKRGLNISGLITSVLNKKNVQTLLVLVGLTRSQHEPSGRVHTKEPPIEHAHDIVPFVEVVVP
jgi:hypothetical protein